MTGAMGIDSNSAIENVGNNCENTLVVSASYPSAQDLALDSYLLNCILILIMAPISSLTKKV